MSSFDCLRRLAPLSLFLFCSASAGCGKTEALSAAASGIVMGADGHAFAIVRLLSVMDECSNAGGEHYTFSIDEPGRRTPRLAHGGGHSVYVNLVPSSSKRTMLLDDDVVPSTSKPTAPEEYVAEMALSSKTDKGDDETSIRNPGWCLDRLPKYDAAVYRLIKAPDHAAAQRMLEDAASLGLPPPSFTPHVTHVTHPASKKGKEAIAVVRVRSIEATTDRRHITFDSLDGSGPTSIDVSPDEKWWPWLGDILVVGSDGTLRVLATTDKESASRWARHIRTHGWPQSPTDMSTYGNLATERWLVQAKVVAGPPGCGPVLEAPSGSRSNLILPKWRAPAPAGLRVEESVTAVVVARLSDDRCGNNLRATRVYRSTIQNAYSMADIPSGAPLIE